MSARRDALTVGVTLVVLATFLLVWKATQMTDDGAPSAGTAADSRLELDAILRATADALGIEVIGEGGQWSGLSCTGPDGDGSSFLLEKFSGPPLDDVDAGLAVVRGEWERRGLIVRDRAFGTAEGLSGTAADGGIVWILTGPGATVLSGESACRAVAGAQPANAAG